MGADWHVCRSMNKRDNVMYARSTDALVNYETVKYFNNESLESRKYGEVVDLFQVRACYN